MSRFIIVSNRLPITVKSENGVPMLSDSAGGLATALKGPHSKSDSLWIGWPGDISRIEKDRIHELEGKLSEKRFSPVYLSSSEVNKYYEGFSNGVIWPLYHYLVDKVQRSAWADWKAYHEVNQKFADIIASRSSGSDMIWIHDYQLSLLPGLLRKLLPNSKIGFFLHIPFPSSEVFRILPWREEILEGMLGSDLIGFHTYSYLRHFKRAVAKILGSDEDENSEGICINGRNISLGVFPIGIDVERFSSLARKDEVQNEIEGIRHENPDHKILLGVDRLDYTKGLIRRLMSFERLLEREPELRGKVKLIQVVVPSRTKVDSYEHLKKEMDELVGRINSTYGSIKSLPVHYLYRGISQEHLSALYCAADVMLVTPVRDGMNLVAKEFVASRNDENGVLILSEFAGAADELAEALIVNPYDVDRLALFMKKAILMSENEKTSRMKRLRERVFNYDAFHWTSAFVNALEKVAMPLANQPLVISSPDDFEKLFEKIKRVPEIHLFLDYDGTLVPFAETPEIAVPDKELLEIISALSVHHGIDLHLVSGRTRDTLEKWFGHFSLSLHAEHGFFSKMSPESEWIQNHHENPAWKAMLEKLLDEYTLETPGSMVERKSGGVAWHYRMSDPEMGVKQARNIRKRVDIDFQGSKVEMFNGEKVLEFRAKGVNKGAVILKTLQKNPGSSTCIAIGDDRTDEDMFAVLPPGSIGIHVGKKNTRAAFRFADIACTRLFLRKLSEL
ncbi:MAG: bifunctional alpha,alpha-trehalose-phosphate synthase (UDP-forming)/trehalose-phosphatase [Candidatus Riflebacteria bacterium]|nr:bifunctional alpha,alpha-trehalose-phosphate synthase (UDP-forming)/trehalose-phosphatase [Candidatus Riflebacteria bacterium]